MLPILSRNFGKRCGSGQPPHLFRMLDRRADRTGAAERMADQVAFRDLEIVQPRHDVVAHRSEAYQPIRIRRAAVAWGKRSGGHFNPAVTFTFYWLGKMEFWDAWLYVIAQFLGAIGGVALARYVLRGALGNHAVRYGVTVPGVYGSTVAFVAELAISFFLMITVLFATNHKRLASYTAYFVGVLIATYFTFEAPLSGMSTNPARTFGSALHANYWHALWIYFIAPSMGMLAAGEVFLRS
jgi:glycerol uptake facilitator-like aquaporin